jgi:hypothetical protein
MWQEIKPILQNRYILIILGATAWMFFFDRYDLLSQYALTRRLKQMEVDKVYYTTEIARIQREKELIQHSPYHVERFAREQFMVRRDNDDVFVFVPSDSLKIVSE